MTARRPPAPTLWLMERFGVGQDLVGDLIERFARGRSRIWFWRQALLAIAIGSVRDIAGHKLLFVRAVVIGLLAINALASGYFAILPLFINVAPVRYPVALMALAGLLYLATGWSIARLHRPYGAGMTVGVVALGWIYRAPEVFRHVANVLQHSRYWPHAEAWMINAVMASFALIAGGLLGARGSDSTPLASEATVAPGQ